MDSEGDRSRPSLVVLWCLVIGFGFLADAQNARAEQLVSHVTRNGLAGRTPSGRAPKALPRGITVYRPQGTFHRPLAPERSAAPSYSVWLLLSSVMIAAPPLEVASVIEGNYGPNPSPVTELPREENPNNPNGPDGPNEPPPSTHSPEPASLVSALLGSVLAGMAGYRRCRKGKEMTDDDSADEPILET